jgi:hypothetical protein
MGPIMMELVWEVINETASVVPPAPPGAAYAGEMVCHTLVDAGCAHPQIDAGCAYMGECATGPGM